MNYRGGQTVTPWKGSVDPTWTVEDVVRANTFDARFIAIGVSHSDRSKLVPLAVWKRKFPGLLYAPDIEAQLKTLLFD
jgi:hypothetical protein